MGKLEKRDWTKIVAESNGSSVFVPEQFLEKCKEWNKIREDYNERVLEMSERQITMERILTDLHVDIRSYLKKQGYKDIFVKDMGFEMGAIEDGKFILNISEPKIGR